MQKNKNLFGWEYENSVGYLPRRTHARTFGIVMMISMMMILMGKVNLGRRRLGSMRRRMMGKGSCRSRRWNQSFGLGHGDSQKISHAGERAKPTTQEDSSTDEMETTMALFPGPLTTTALQRRIDGGVSNHQEGGLCQR